MTGHKIIKDKSEKGLSKEKIVEKSFDKSFIPKIPNYILSYKHLN